MMRYRQVQGFFQNLKWLLRSGGLHLQLEQLNDQIRGLQLVADQLQRRERSHAWVYGRRMHVNPDDHVISPTLSDCGCFEEFETELMRQWVQPGNVVLDVGANIGYYTLQFAELAGPTGHVFAFEPDPRNFTLLKRNVLQNQYANVTLVPKAVSSASGALRLFRNSENDGDHRTYESEPGRECVAIDAVALDDFFADYAGPIDLLKFDIQGFEAIAFAGMKKLLAKHRRLRIVTEFWPRGIHLSGRDPEAFLRSLLDLGFDVQVIDSEAERLVPLDIRATLDRLPVEQDTDIFFTNLYCQRN
jgi:FkbM family methyltransferase